MPKRNPILSIASVVSVVLMATVVAVFAQQSTAQQNCLNKLNKDGSGVAKAQGKENVGCLKGAGKGTLVGSAQTCLTADAKGKVAKAKSKTSGDDAAACTTPPTFGYTGAAAINTAAQQGEVDLMADIFGANMDPAVIDCTSNKLGCKCQQKVLGDVEKLVDTKLKEFVKCKKAALKAGASTAGALTDCVNNAGTAGSIAADTKGKIAKGAAKIGAEVVKTCDTPGVTAGAFPGTCTGQTGNTLATCLDTQAECRVCTIINQMDGLFVNCDLFDNGVADSSCDSGTGPTPTPTATATPVPTATQTPTPAPTATCNPGATFRGTLANTTGRFNYNLTLGLAGANAACNTAFACSHACTVSDLQTAEVASEFLALPNTSFWAIDSAQPLNRQCGLTIRWDYQTADHPSFGDKIAVTSGHLGAVSASQICATTAAVGCCQ